MKDRQRRLFLSWNTNQPRSESLSFYLGATYYSICPFEGIAGPGHYFSLPLKYVLASLKTLLLLKKKRPDIIFVVNPPIFAPLIVWIYCRMNKVHYVIDTHSAAFNWKRWTLFQWLHKFLSRDALMNLLHNEPLAQTVTSWGAHSMTLADGPPQLATDGAYPLRDGFNAAVICTYSRDEPIEVVLEAAQKMPLTNFYVTGHINRASESIINRASSNIILTDYLPKNEYIALLTGCSVVICLTLDDNTMQCGAHEAMELGRPIITSNWPVLRDYFSKGTIHIDNTANSLVHAITEIRTNYKYYGEQIQILRKERQSTWDKGLSELEEVLKNA
jgi:glycosyltransferase involved in cell wall biosynthesis